jgi:hypothetical protein
MFFRSEPLTVTVISRGGPPLFVGDSDEYPVMLPKDYSNHIEGQQRRSGKDKLGCAGTKHPIS